MKHIIKMTASELIDAGYWDEYCEITGTTVWAVNEGLMDGDEEIEVPDPIASRILARERDRIERTAHDFPRGTGEMGQ